MIVLLNWQTIEALALSILTLQSQFLFAENRQKYSLAMVWKMIVLPGILKYFCVASSPKAKIG